MTKEQYRAAFSKLQPSEEAVDRLLAIPTEQPKPRRRIRLGALIAACVAALGLLTGAVFAASRHWFRLSDESAVTLPTLWQGERVDQPQHELRMDSPERGFYTGFLLNGWELPDAEQVQKSTLRERLEHYGLLSASSLEPALTEDALCIYEAITAEGEILRIEVLDQSGIGYRSYYTRYETELVKEGELNGLSTIWLRVEDPPIGDTWNLFCRSEAFGCTVVISSSRDFARAEEAASCLRLVSSGVEVPRSSTRTDFALRCAKPPFGLKNAGRQALDRFLSGAILAQDAPDLRELYFELVLTRSGQAEAVVHVYSYPVDFASFDNFTLEKTGTVNGMPASYYRVREPFAGGSSRECTAIILSGQAGTQSYELEIRVLAAELLEQPDFLSELVQSIEVVPVEIVRDPPLEFHGLSVG